MNIFVLSEQECPINSARSQCDQHIVSQAKESCQLLQTCFTLDRLAESDCPRTQKGTTRGHFNPKHPCSIWIRKSTGNMDWLILHAQEQFAEYTRRYGKRHFTEDFLDWVINNIDDAIVPEGDRTPFLPAITSTAKCRELPSFSSSSIVDKYRLFYKHDKPFAKWEKGRKAPDWFFDKKYA